VKATPENILMLEPGQIFVFGSNTAGIHGKGAARTATLLFGADRGVAEGPTGRCYAIPTRIYIPRDDTHWRVRFETMPLNKIEAAIHRFMDYADQHMELEFLVTKLGCGYAGYKAEEIAPFFRNNRPVNVVLPLEFH